MAAYVKTTLTSQRVVHKPKQWCYSSYIDFSISYLSTPLSSNWPRISNVKRQHGFLLHHGKGDPVGCHWSCLHRDPQVFLVIARALFLLRFWPRCHHCVSAAAATAAARTATAAAAVAAHHQSCEEDQQGESEENHEADGVVGSLGVFFCHKAPKLVEKVLDAVYFPIHGFQIQSCSSF